MTPKDVKERQPVGVLPYRFPPLSGLYRLRYRPPPLSTCFSKSSSVKSNEAGKGIHTTEHADTSRSQVAPCPSTPIPSSSTDAGHRQLHAQILQSTSLEEGIIDLFLLYSICDVEPVPCSQCSLNMDTTLRTCSYRLRETYTVVPNSIKQQHPNPAQSDEAKAAPSFPLGSSQGDSALLAQLQEGWYAFFFPMSECGLLKDNLLVCVNGALIAGDVAQCDFESGGLLRPLQNKAPFGASTPYASSPFSWKPAGRVQQITDVSTGATSPLRRLKPLFYYVVSPVNVYGGKRGAGEGPAPTDVVITISWRSYPSAQSPPQSLKKNKNMFTLLYSYYCSPRAPDTLTCRAQFQTDTHLRLVRSPNCEGIVQLKSEVTEHSAKLRVETLDGTPLETHRHPKDYTFQILFYFGNYTGLIEETSWCAAFTVVVVFLILLWFFLTKGLVV
ncbi:hypothetical protein ABL78_7849 [Leptomonas seymouri]|uniref:Transmembrane protein n=1 Tax=Leptomonas seymouri TaxID=5684 RepID=A0A0N1IHK0_LEPSE|nr:hypothetical protein ABL78_7849 [Leptomonas seymouri]|eukprot:KPI83128.1 hypothetical protein ABL78_7849 [Leptomonas seymouri]